MNSRVSRWFRSYCSLSWIIGIILGLVLLTEDKDIEDVKNLQYLVISCLNNLVLSNVNFKVSWHHDILPGLQRNSTAGSLFLTSPTKTTEAIIAIAFPLKPCPIFKCHVLQIFQMVCIHSMRCMYCSFHGVWLPSWWGDCQFVFLASSYLFMEVRPHSKFLLFGK